ncbi:VUT family protein [Nitratireductor aestuarii]|nr:VUT family protein [Nitratireductor aestuarii]
MNSQTPVWPFMVAMAVVVTASNFLVQYPFEHFGLGEILTWGAFTYPVAFLITDLTNRTFGVRAARKLVLIGFILAFGISAWLASPRIAIASGMAFLCAQLLDVSIFDRLRNGTWWKAPFISSFCGSVLDTIIFFGIAFAARFAFLDTSLGLEDGSLAFAVPLLGFGPEVPLWVSLGLGDFLVKISIALLMLVPYGALLSVFQPMIKSARRVI